VPISEAGGDLAERLCSLCTVVIDEGRLRLSPGVSMFDAGRSRVTERGAPESSGDDDRRADDRQNDSERIDVAGGRSDVVEGVQMGGGRQVDGGRVGLAEAIGVRGDEALLRSDALCRSALKRRLRGGSGVPEWRLGGEGRSLVMRHRAIFTEVPAVLSAASVRVCSLAIRWVATRSSSARTCGEAEGSFHASFAAHPSNI